MPKFSTQQLTDDIARAISAEEFDAAAATALENYDALNSAIIAQKNINLDCHKGCSICCCLRVDVFAHEIFLIAHHIRSHFTAEATSLLLDRLETHTQAVLPLTPSEHATTNIGCPLLQEGQCTIYKVRPHSCRRHHSQDVTACQYTFDHPTDLETPAAHDRDLFRALTEALHQNIEVYAEFGFDYTIYELGTSLREALNDPTSWQRWLDRKQAFIDSSVTPAA